MSRSIAISGGTCGIDRATVCGFTEYGYEVGQALQEAEEAHTKVAMVTNARVTRERGPLRMPAQYSPEVLATSLVGLAAARTGR
ncbi:hypothetical protein PV416_02285 [Streptomyces ipomoeae]|jgi:hypothetical protein|uniref:hypothetical protein n=1 Tax=Streptomyces ipomoeae TaxID=103232 RepID=UPI0029AA6723|nr:hypothetical protein [Streptomyces ipomoeae]MDX2819930.1 hypothetical protein [Streptomyces ipomoeae]MDX2872624.1 hypothetical protein [Streptomyces ipomoeae]